MKVSGGGMGWRERERGKKLEEVEKGARNEGKWWCGGVGWGRGRSGKGKSEEAEKERKEKIMIIKM